MMDAKHPVYQQFKPLLDPKQVGRITKEQFWAFLSFEGNQHWTGLVRQAPRVCSDMPRLRKALAVLLDEKEPVASRLDKVFKLVPGMGRAIATAVLHVAEPDRYGVWNGTSEGSMKFLDIWPEFERGESTGQRYVRVNEMLLRLAGDLDTSLWLLDSLWWRIRSTDEPNSSEPVTDGDDCCPTPDTAQTLGFGMERHLHEFLRDNWAKTPLGKDWVLYSEEGNEEAGYEYPCRVGRIDLLARHKRESAWLVVELKRNQTSDSTVGQLLRYMGWVKHHLAEPKERVQGLIIAREVDDSLQYALTGAPNVDVQLYEVGFSLKPPLNSVAKRNRN